MVKTWVSQEGEVRVEETMENQMVATSQSISASTVTKSTISRGIISS